MLRRTYALHDWTTNIVVVVGTAALLLALTPLAVFAHERRAVDKYSFLVGFNVEPALNGQPNGAQLTVTVPSENNRPVEGLADTLKMSVVYGGGQPKELKVSAVSGTPGRYVGSFIPTRPGTYIFRFTGSIEGMPIDQRFESGPGRFSDVDDVTQIQFPEPAPPTNEVDRQAQGAVQQAQAAQTAVDQMRTMAIAGVAVGALGIILATIAIVLAWNRRASPSARV